MRKTLLTLAIIGLMGGFSAVQASEGHSHGEGHGHDDSKKHSDSHEMGGHKEGHGHDDGHAEGHGDKHSHGKEGHGDHKMSGMFLKKKQIDGYNVSFHVMKPATGPSMGGSHHFMVKVEKDGKTVDGIVMNTKVVYPDGTSESKKTMKMNGWLMAGYNMKDSGRHQLMILFKTPDGKKHKGGVYYP